MGNTIRVVCHPIKSSAIAEYEFYVHRECKISNLKEKYLSKVEEEKVGISDDSVKINSLKFTFKDKVLKNDNTLASYNINNGDSINVSVLINVICKESMVQNAIGNVYAIEVYENNTILDLKLKFLTKSTNQSNISHDSQLLNFLKLVYQGEVLDNNKTLESYEICDKDAVMVIKEMIRGMIRVVCSGHSTKSGAIAEYGFHVHRECKISDLKEKYLLKVQEEKVGISDDSIKINSFKFTFQDQVLRNNNTLESYNINNGDTINVSVLIYEKIKVICKESMLQNASGNTYAIEVYENSTVLELKLKFLTKSTRQISNVSHDSELLAFLKFVFQGEVLDNENTLESYEIGDKDSVMVITGTNGGFNYYPGK